MPDPVCEAINKLRALLKDVPCVEIPLGNGQIEKQLKLFVVSALATDNSIAGSYRSVTDKYYAPPGSKRRGPELDLVALTKEPGDTKYSRPQLWIEFKSKFREESSNKLLKCVRETLTQVEKCLNKLRPSSPREHAFTGATQEAIAFWKQLINCPVYVVHFLGSTPKEDCGLSRVILKKYPRSNGTSGVKLKEVYEDELQQEHRSWHGHVFGPIRIWDKPAIDAIVTKLEVRDGKIVRTGTEERVRAEVAAVT